MKVELWENWKAVPHSHPHTEKGRGEEERVESVVVEGQLCTGKETGLPTRRSSGMERLKVHSWLLTTASVMGKECKTACSPLRRIPSSQPPLLFLQLPLARRTLAGLGVVQERLGLRVVLRPPILVAFPTAVAGTPWLLSNRASKTKIFQLASPLEHIPKRRSLPQTWGPGI